MDNNKEGWGRLLRKWNELIGIPVAILLYWGSPHLIRIFDPTSASYDGSFLQLGILSLVIFFTFTSIVRIYIGLIFPRMELHLDKYLFQGLTQWQKGILSIALFCGLLLALVGIANALS